MKDNEKKFYEETAQVLGVSPEEYLAQKEAEAQAAKEKAEAEEKKAKPKK